MEDNKVLLDYYTKNMTLHATITVGVVFGLFSLLGIITSVKSWVIRIFLTLGFVSLVLFGWYVIKRFKHYGKKAKDMAVQEFGADEGKEERGIMGLLMNQIFTNAEIFFIVFMTYSLVLVWLGFFL